MDINPHCLRISPVHGRLPTNLAAELSIGFPLPRMLTLTQVSFAKARPSNPDNNRDDY
jgi:hypothetical protein